MIREFQLITKEKNEMINIDSYLEQAIREEGVKNGSAIVYCPHTTAAITINENADPDVKRDLLYLFGKISPHYESYRHFEGNSDAHGKACLVGLSQTLLIGEGKPIFGQWQSLYFCEFDGPRHRKFYIKITKDVEEEVK